MSLGEHDSPKFWKNAQRRLRTKSLEVPRNPELRPEFCWNMNPSSMMSLWPHVTVTYCRHVAGMSARHDMSCLSEALGGTTWHRHFQLSIQAGNVNYTRRYPIIQYISSLAMRKYYDWEAGKQLLAFTHLKHQKYAPRLADVTYQPITRNHKDIPCYQNTCNCAHEHKST